MKDQVMRLRTYLCSIALLSSLAFSATPVAAEANFRPIGRSGTQKPWLWVATPNSTHVNLTEDAATAARRTVRSVAPWSDSSELESVHTWQLPDQSKVVAFAQRINGVPVMSRGARVITEADGRVSMVTVHLLETKPISMTPGIDALRAKSLAASKYKLWTDSPDAQLIVVPSQTEPRLAWGIVGGIDALPTRPVVLVDAQTGRIIAKYESGSFAKSAKMYPYNPIATPTLQDVTLETTNEPTTDGLESKNLVARNCIDKKTVRTVSIGGAGKITAHVCDLVATVKADSQGNYTGILPPDDTSPEDSFAELSMFFHTHRAYSYARTLGLPVAKERPVTAVANLRIPSGLSNFDVNAIKDPELPLEPFDNAFYAPKDPLFSSAFSVSTDAMWFGQGTVSDFGYDGDVVYHEFGHFLVNMTLKLVGYAHADDFGLSWAPGAMNEGLADVFSSFITGDGDVGEYASKGLGSGKAIRSLDNNVTLPSGLTGEVHHDSLPFTGPIWKVYQSLDSTKKQSFQKAVMKTMVGAATGDLGFVDLANMLVASIKQNVDEQTGASLETEFSSRGILPTEKRIIEYTGSAIRSISSALAFASPGLNSTLEDVVPAPGILQFRVKVPKGKSSLVVEFDAPQRAGVFGSSNPLTALTASPFAPVLLVKEGADPITFKYSKPFVLDARTISCTLTTVNSKRKAGKCTGEIDLSASASTTPSIHLMIGNEGETDGTYDNVRVTTTLISAPDTPDAGADGAVNPATPTTSSSGCSCQTVPSHGWSAPGIALFAIALGATRLRSKRSRRPQRSS